MPPASRRIPAPPPADFAPSENMIQHGRAATLKKEDSNRVPILVRRRLEAPIALVHPVLGGFRDEPVVLRHQMNVGFVAEQAFEGPVAVLHHKIRLAR